jgi:hypothetical protein
MAGHDLADTVLAHDDGGLQIVEEIAGGLAHLSHGGPQQRFSARGGSQEA